MPGSFGRVTPWTAYLRAERAAQYEAAGHDDPRRGAVAVRLYAPEKMSAPDARDFHERISFRVWMAGEYRVLGREEVRQMKAKWDKR